MILGLILSPDHAWRAQAAAIGTVAYDGDTQSLGDAARAPLDVLAVDAAELVRDDLDTIRAYRIARPQTRIVVALPAGAEPGNPVWATLVGMGIYDLAQGLSLRESLDRNPTYADAVRWTGDLDLETGKLKPKVEIRERIVERRVPLTQRPVLVAVAGLGPGAGTTTLAAAIGSYLARTTGARTALAEYGAPALYVLANGKQEWARGLHVLARSPLTAENPYDAASPDDPPTPRDLVRGREYPYVVVDLGNVGLADARAYEPDLLVLALPGDLHRFVSQLRVRQAEDEPLEELPGVVIGGSRSSARQVRGAWRSAERGAEILPLPARDVWPPASAEGDKVLASILGSVLPDTPGPRGRIFGSRYRPRRPPHAALPRPMDVSPPDLARVPAYPPTTAATSSRGGFGLRGVLSVAGWVVETGLSAAVVGIAIWLGLLGWQAIDPAGPASQYLATMTAWLHRI